jgi:hypothetical protein
MGTVVDFVSRLPSAGATDRLPARALDSLRGSLEPFGIDLPRAILARVILLGIDRAPLDFDERETLRAIFTLIEIDSIVEIL